MAKKVNWWSIGLEVIRLIISALAGGAAGASM